MYGKGQRVVLKIYLGFIELRNWSPRVHSTALTVKYNLCISPILELRAVGSYYKAAVGTKALLKGNLAGPQVVNWYLSAVKVKPTIGNWSSVLVWVLPHDVGPASASYVTSLSAHPSTSACSPCNVISQRGPERHDGHADSHGRWDQGVVPLPVIGRHKECVDPWSEEHHPLCT